jgi:hypothetical protein
MPGTPLTEETAPSDVREVYGQRCVITEVAELVPEVSVSSLMKSTHLACKATFEDTISSGIDILFLPSI